MAKTGHQKLAEALDAVQKVSIGNIVHAKSIQPAQKTLLSNKGYLKKIVNSWYLLDGDLIAQTTGGSALWFESIWAFIGQYVTHLFDENYWLSPEASLDLHTDNNR